jgi:hypothetical protein
LDVRHEPYALLMYSVVIATDVLVFVSGANDTLMNLGQQLSISIKCLRKCLVKLDNGGKKTPSNGHTDAKLFTGMDKHHIQEIRSLTTVLVDVVDDAELRYISPLFSLPPLPESPPPSPAVADSSHRQVLGWLCKDAIFGRRCDSFCRFVWSVVTFCHLFVCVFVIALLYFKEWETGCLYWPSCTKGCEPLALG